MTLLNPYVIGAIIAGLLMSFTGGGLLGWHEKALRVPALLDAQKTTDQTACATAQQLTKDTNDGIQKSDTYITQRAAALGLQHPSACVRASSRTHIPASGPQHAGQDGAVIDTGQLRAYAADAETYRTNLSECTEFLTKERELFKPAQ